MKALFDQIERVKGKPHHVRHQVAFGSAGVITALIALVWLTASFSTGAFAVKSGSQEAPESESVASSQIAGAAGAFDNEDAKGEARIEIVDAKATTSARQAEQTIIPF